jgi:hypothetical protein
MNPKRVGLCGKSIGQLEGPCRMLVNWGPTGADKYPPGVADLT